MGLFSPFLAAGAFIASYAFGANLAQGKKWAALAGVGICLPVVAAPVLFHYFPGIEAPLLEMTGYFYLRRWLLFPFAFCILGIGTLRMSRQASRAVVSTVAGALLAVASYRAGVAATFNPADLSGTPNANGMCMQTSQYSCGAAAAVTFLAHLDITATEEEMARLCCTSAPIGTDPFSACRGLQKKLEGTGHDVEIRRCNWEDLRQCRMPVMAVINVGFMLDHWVVVLSVDDETVVLADPTNGLLHVSREKFLREWRHILIAMK